MSEEYKGIEWFENEAENGNVDYQYEVGMYYRYVINSSERINGNKFCAHWFEMAAKNGQKDAMYEYGKLFQYGDDYNEKDIDKYQLWTNKAENYGIHESRELIDLDIFRDFMNGYKSGDIDAEVRAAICLRQSEEDFKDSTDDMLRHAATNKSGLANFLLGIDIYSEIEEASVEELSLMYKHFYLAALLGNLGAKSILIPHLMKGDVMDKDIDLAKEYANDVYMSKNDNFSKQQAQFYLGEIALFNLDGEDDYDAAHIFLESAAYDARVGDRYNLMDYMDATDEVLRHYKEKYEYTWMDYDYSERLANLSVMYSMMMDMGEIIDLN